MKQVPLMLIILLCGMPLFAQEENKKTDPVLYCLEQTDEDHAMNSYTYPRPELPHEQLREFIKQRLTYPETGKRTFKASSFVFSIHIDEHGKSKPGIVFNSGQADAETIAKNILFDSLLKWKPAKRNKKAIALTVAIPVTFYTTYSNGKMYFKAQFFVNDEPFVLDSTDTHPALFNEDEDKETFFVFDKNFLTPAALHNDKPYGAVQFGFEIDTNGHIADLKIITSIDPVLDTLALRSLEKTNGKWIAATKNGQKVPSYKYFNCLYNDIYFKEISGASYLTMRKDFEKSKTLSRFLHFSLANADRSTALDLLDNKQYKEALVYFNKALRYYIRDADLYMKRAVAYYYAEDIPNACKDLRTVMDVAEVEGYPLGMSREQVEQMIIKFCQ